jgi:hypothetical protein
MGLRPADVASFFAPTDRHAVVLRERARWLAEEPPKYAALTTAAETALDETVQLARSLDATLNVESAAPTERFATLLALGRAWEPDFVWMHPGHDSVHRLVGGVVCFPSSWALTDKLGRPMREVHDPVPGLDEALGRQIDVFLTKLEPGVAWTRENWNLGPDDELNHHPSRPRRLFDADVEARNVWVRLEHQLLLKLPRSGSVLFGIRVEVIALSNVLAEPEVAARLARLFETMSPAAAAYKRVTPQLVAMLRNAAGTRDCERPSGAFPSFEAVE